jgi:hypothetical protein
MRDGGRILLAAVNLYVRIEINVATSDTNHLTIPSLITRRQSVAASIQILPDSATKSAQPVVDGVDMSGETIRLSICQAKRSGYRYVRRNDQVIDTSGETIRLSICQAKRSGYRYVRRNDQVIDTSEVSH